jgi:hypothetical protein
VPHGIEGTIIDIQRLKRTEGDDLNPGVDEVVKALIATKRKLREGTRWPAATEIRASWRAFFLLKTCRSWTTALRSTFA